MENSQLMPCRLDSPCGESHGWKGIGLEEETFVEISRKLSNDIRRVDSKCSQHGACRLDSGHRANRIFIKDILEMGS